MTYDVITDPPTRVTHVLSSQRETTSRDEVRNGERVCILQNITAYWEAEREAAITASYKSYHQCPGKAGKRVL